MFTLGYRWRPWPGDTALADGDLILTYMRKVAEEYGVDRLIRYDHKVVAADWDSTSSRWNVTIERGGETVELTASLLWGCTGYYDYETGHTPAFPGQERFTGQIVYPQFWPEDLDYADKNVVVIGSGATAVTLVPALARTTKHVTMLQRSPTYIVPQPDRDPLARLLALAPTKLSYPLVRGKNVGILIGSYQLSRRFPNQMKAVFRKLTEPRLPDSVSYDEHFQPTYNPWDQRLCVVPNGDLFKALRHGTASVVTDTIDTFTETGIRTTRGEELPADIIVSATGLKLLAFGGIGLTVDGVKLEPKDTMSYRALMLSGIPNFIYTLGYTNASWTLKADLVSEFVVRLLRHMDKHGHSSVVPVRDESVGERPFMELTSGYIQRSLDELPRQGDREPWLLKQNYIIDQRQIRRGRIDDGVLAFA